MINTFKKLIKKYIPQNRILQKVYLGCYYFGIWGMNYGIGGDIHQTGEVNALKILKRRFKGKDPVLFDVGANVGDYTKILRSTFPNAEIHSFEPIKSAFSLLKENVGAFTNITIHNIGLGDEEKDIITHYNPELLSRSSMVSFDLKHHDMELTEEEVVTIETLDLFCEKGGIRHIDFLKIDVEGYELNVLKGAEKLISNKQIDCIQFEFGGTQINAKVFFKDLWNTLNGDYHIYRILRNDLQLVNSYTESLEIFHFSNFMAIRRQ